MEEYKDNPTSGLRETVRPGLYGLDAPQTLVPIILSSKQTTVLMRQCEEGGAVLCLLALGCTLNAPAECTTSTRPVFRRLHHHPLGRADDPIAHVTFTYHAHRIARLCAL
jgi:hypothetical protein